jgi:hypothetical protein
MPQPCNQVMPITAFREFAPKMATRLVLAPGV